MVTLTFCFCGFGQFWPQVTYRNLYCFVYWAILENIASAERVILRINSFSIVLLGNPTLKANVLDIDNVSIMTPVGIRGEIETDPRISLTLRPRELPWAQAIFYHISPSTVAV